MSETNETADAHDGDFRNDLRSQLVATGTAAAEQWLSTRANRRMSDVNKRRLAGAVINAIWDDIVDSTLGLAEYLGAEQVAAATERAETAEAEVTRLRTAVAGLVEQDDAEVKRQREMNRGLAKGNIRAMNRATKAEDERERLAERVAELEAERAALAAYRLAADTEPDDELTRVWPTLNHLPCGAGIFGYDPMDADELDLATLLRVVAEHRCATAPDAPACECGCLPGQPCICTLNDCECIGDCPVCDADDATHQPG